MAGTHFSALSRIGKFTSDSRGEFMDRACRWSLTLLAGVLAIGCGGTEVPGDRGSMTVSFSNSAQVQVDLLRLDVTCPGHTWTQDYPVGDLATLTARVDNLPVGTCDFSARAWKGSDTSLAPTLEGSATGVTVLEGITQNLLIVLRGNADPQLPFTNSAPFIRAIIISEAAVAPGTDVFLEVLAEDDDGDVLSYAWTTSHGTFDEDDVEFVVCTAPQTSSQLNAELSVTVSDPHGASSWLSVEISVDPVYSKGSVEVTFTVELNEGPIVTALTSHNELGFDPNYDEIDVFVLEASATDAEGHSLTYTWGTNGGCGSFLVPDGNGDPSFVDATEGQAVTFVTDDPNGCEVELVVIDELGAMGTGTLIIRQHAPIFDFEPLIFDTTQSATQLQIGNTVTFSARVLVPGFAGLPNVAWNTADAGSATMAYIDPASPELGVTLTATWTAASCFDSKSVILDVDGVFESFNTHTFHVAPAPGAECP